MKNIFKKKNLIIFTPILIFVIVICLVVLNNKNKAVTPEKEYNTEIITNLLRQNSLSEDKMYATVKDYWLGFNKVFEYTKENIQVQVKKTEKGAVQVITAQNARTKIVHKWDSVQDAFIYLCKNAFSSVSGEILITPDMIIEEFASVQSDPNNP